MRIAMGKYVMRTESLVPFCSYVPGGSHLSITPLLGADNDVHFRTGAVEQPVWVVGGCSSYCVTTSLSLSLSLSLSFSLSSFGVQRLRDKLRVILRSLVSMVCGKLRQQNRTEDGGCFLGETGGGFAFYEFQKL